jgi:hypothetical protein
VSTAPLTRDETWMKAQPGTLWVFRGGDLIRIFEPAPDYVSGPSKPPAWAPA